MVNFPSLRLVWPDGREVTVTDPTLVRMHERLVEEEIEEAIKSTKSGRAVLSYKSRSVQVEITQLFQDAA